MKAILPFLCTKEEISNDKSLETAGVFLHLRSLGYKPKSITPLYFPIYIHKVDDVNLLVDPSFYSNYKISYDVIPSKTDFLSKLSSVNTEEQYIVFLESNKKRFEKFEGEKIIQTDGLIEPETKENIKNLFQYLRNEDLKGVVLPVGNFESSTGVVSKVVDVIERCKEDINSLRNIEKELFTFSSSLDGKISSKKTDIEDNYRRKINEIGLEISSIEDTYRFRIDKIVQLDNECGDTIEIITESVKITLKNIEEERARLNAEMKKIIEDYNKQIEVRKKEIGPKISHLEEKRKKELELVEKDDRNLKQIETIYKLMALGEKFGVDQAVKPKISELEEITRKLKEQTENKKSSIIKKYDALIKAENEDIARLENERNTKIKINREQLNNLEKRSNELEEERDKKISSSKQKYLSQILELAGNSSAKSKASTVSKDKTDEYHLQVNYVKSSLEQERDEKINQLRMKISNLEQERDNAITDLKKTSDTINSSTKDMSKDIEKLIKNKEKIVKSFYNLGFDLPENLRSNTLYIEFFSTSYEKNGEFKFLVFQPVYYSKRKRGFFDKDCLPFLNLVDQKVFSPIKQYLQDELQQSKELSEECIKRNLFSNKDLVTSGLTKIAEDNWIKRKEIEKIIREIEH